MGKSLKRNEEQRETERMKYIKSKIKMSNRWHDTLSLFFYPVFLSSILWNNLSLACLATVSESVRNLFFPLLSYVCFVIITVNYESSVNISAKTHIFVFRKIFQSTPNVTTYVIVDFINDMSPVLTNNTKPLTCTRSRLGNHMALQDTEQRC